MGIVEGLEKLAALHTDGALSDAEFDEAKAVAIAESKAVSEHDDPATASEHDDPAADIAANNMACELWMFEAQSAAHLAAGRNSDNKPDIASIKATVGATTGPTEKADPAEAATRPFDAAKCSARVWNHGYGPQCTRSHLEDCKLCGCHHDIFLKLPEGKDIAFGRYNQARPTHSLDKGLVLEWADTRRALPRSSGKLKVSELRDYLSTRIPNETFKGLKKAELQVMYDKLKSEGAQEAQAILHELGVPQESMVDSGESKFAEFVQKYHDGH